MKNKQLKRVIIALLIVIGIVVESCGSLKQSVREENKTVPESYATVNSKPLDTVNSAQLNYKKFYNDEKLIGLIELALSNNQELNIFNQEIEVLKNESLARKGEYLPFVGVGAEGGIEKTSKFTRDGAVEENLTLPEGKAFPEPLGDLKAGLYSTWEVDIWKKLRNGQKAAVNRFLASQEGKNFLKTNLVAEIASSYYELEAFDNMLEIINKNIDIQSKALSSVKQQKEAAKVSQLAVNRFEAQLLNTINRQYEIKQKIVETENRLNYLTGRYPTPLERLSNQFIQTENDSISIGIPSQLLLNRPDVKKAEKELEATKFDVKSARANFYPNLALKAGVGFQAFNPSFLIRPDSFIYNAAGELMAPLINRKAIKAAYASANAKQLQAVISFEQTLLNAYVDVLNQEAKVDNFSNSFRRKSEEVKILLQSINTANLLFNSARADYTEVLLTQREALEAKLELVEIKYKQLDGKIQLYRALGGGWK
ncbi:TolC family protein [Flavobacterium capsici]|uniref:TolC family protein n=1 Tax=Flavobacterium capsici TaxID=3075618 RepID=A0AA96J7M2_9FLAO|nr:MULTISPECIES: TolC family protein [unclassified Flavobacterium]WNM20106.1 TolC family protein [Flavobacterium sp. PMR2A8]WNM21496.1 TolC family protein [Flavobacterium sp. PMTSA4]